MLKDKEKLDKEEAEENELIQVAMQIILHAGNGRTKAQEAIGFAKKMDFENARKAMEEARGNIVLAHKAQTTVIQNEAAGNSYEPCLLFTHAQDHLMTITSEINLTKDLIDFFEIAMNK